MGTNSIKLKYIIAREIYIKIPKYTSCKHEKKQGNTRRYKNDKEKIAADSFVLFVNDGSKDKTLRIARQYAERYADTVRVIDKPNGNYGSTINAALPTLKGEYVKILDADDSFDSSAIEPFVETARRVRQLGLGLNAGHDLSLENLTYFAERIPWCDEVSIGHALIADALYLGLENTVQLYLRCLASTK